MRQNRSGQLLDDLVAAIRSGALAAGTRLPTHRELARQHGIALETATRVYRKLGQMGLTVGETGRGTFVRDQLGFDGLAPTRTPPSALLADLAVNEPLAPGQAEHLRAALRGLATSGNLEALLRQEPPGGRVRDRQLVATYLLGRGIDVPPANVLITNGSQQGLDAALDATTRPGDLIALDGLSYPGMRMLAESRAHDFAAIPVCPHAPDLDALDHACRTRQVRAIYVMPTMHNPLSWVLSLSQRTRIVEIARRRNVWVIEDGTYAFLAPDAPRPIQALAPERTVYVGSLSKNVASGLRFGYVVAPDPLVERLRGGLRASTYGSPSIVTAVAVGWLGDGTVERLEHQRRADAAQRQAIARAVLGSRDYLTHSNSYILWLPLQAPQRMDAVAAALASQGVLVGTGDRYATNGNAPHALRVALATPPLDTLARALDLVRTAIDTIE